MMPEHEVKIEIATHHFIVTEMSWRVLAATREYSRKFLTWTWAKKNGKFSKTEGKLYAAHNKSQTGYRFHINCLEDYYRVLDAISITDKLRVVIEKPLYEPMAAEFKLKEGLAPYEDQVPVLDFVYNYKGRTTLIGLETGKGKTVLAMFMMAHEKQRIAIVIKPKYIDRWVTGFKDAFELEPGDLLVVKGSKDLQALLDQQYRGVLKAKAIIFSNRTLQSWFKLFTQFGTQITNIGYACLPYNLFEFLKIGRRYIDEVHQDFHFNFMLDMYTHCPKATSMTATLMSDDPDIEKKQRIAYPTDCRYEDQEFSRHTDSTAWFYRINHPYRIKTMEYGSNNYSHSAFEKSIMRFPPLLRDYLGLIKHVADESYIKKYQPGNKMLVLVSTIKMADHVTDYMKNAYKNMTVKRFVEDDPTENLIDPDIRASTLQSAGTAADVPGLQTTILTQAVKSSTANIQGLGRTRKMKDGQVPEFVWMSCSDIPKHMFYHDHRQKLLRNRTRTYDTRTFGRSLG